jgi:hypothetical protein
MRRRNIIIGLLALVLCGILVSGLWPEKPEPVYKGRKLSDWLCSYEVWLANSHTLEAREALSAIGTNAIPFYLKWLPGKPGPIEMTRLYTAEKAHDWFHSEWSPSYYSEWRSLQIENGFSILGKNAAGAIPTLASYASNSAEHRVRESAILCLAAIGSPALPALVSLAYNRNVEMRPTVINAITSIEPDINTVFQEFSPLLDHADPAKRSQAKQ